MNGDDKALIAPAAFTVVRVWFAKTGRARFISHLDLSRTMARALRRAELPIWYTEGFNRRPYLTFAAPLPLGAQGLRECMDIRLTAPTEMAQVVERLNAVLPPELAVQDAAPARKKPGELAAARWRLTFDCPAETLRAFAAQETITAEKLNKKKERRTVDLKPWLTVPPAGGVWELTLPCGGADAVTVTPALIGQALNAFAGAEIPCRAVRLELLAADGAPYA